MRAFAALLVAALAGGLAIALGAPLAAALISGAVGGVGLWLASAIHAPAAPSTIATPAPETPQPALADLIEAIDDPMLVVERQLVARANGPALKLLGEHIVGEDIRLAIRHPAAAERLTGRVGSEGGSPRASIELVGLGESERRWELVIHELGGGARLVRLRDRTDSYAAERMRVDFVANASHELRTPLATLLGFIETLEDAGDDPAVRARFLKIMFGEAKRMQQLVDDLMSLSRIEAEKYSLPQAALPLGPLVDDVTSAVRSGMREGADRIIIAMEDTPPVFGDRAQLSQLLHNLIGNAIKYGREGAPVQISVKRAGRMVRLTVADEGDGIAPEHLPRLTERFYRVDPGRSRALGGTGLGLAIVKHIVERHRGRLDIDSVVGTGTTVSVLLPAAPEPLS
jgi:two-component system phosphate regulon sensor histidine kinase PhoR